MILLDTNVVSEMMKSAPSQKVVDWIDQQDTLQLYITTITIAEIMYGLRVLPNGTRRRFLETAFEKTVQESFGHRILSFDAKAAMHYGNLMAQRKKLGRPLGILDGQIAAIASSNDSSIATRNLKDFQDCGLVLINPFST